MDQVPVVVPKDPEGVLDREIGEGREVAAEGLLKQSGLVVVRQLEMMS